VTRSVMLIGANTGPRCAEPGAWPARLGRRPGRGPSVPPLPRLRNGGARSPDAV